MADQRSTATTIEIKRASTRPYRKVSVITDNAGSHFYGEVGLHKHTKLCSYPIQTAIGSIIARFAFTCLEFFVTVSAQSKGNICDLSKNNLLYIT